MKCDTILFTEEEREKMGAMIGANMLFNWGRVARVIKQKLSDEHFLYTIRVCRDGYKVEAADEDIVRAKQKFIEETLHVPIPDEVWNRIEKVRVKHIEEQQTQAR